MEEAAIVVQRAVNADATDAEAWFVLARAYRKLGEIRKQIRRSHSIVP